MQINTEIITPLLRTLSGNGLKNIEHRRSRSKVAMHKQAAQDFLRLVSPLTLVAGSRGMSMRKQVAQGIPSSPFTHGASSRHSKQVAQGFPVAPPDPTTKVHLRDLHRLGGILPIRPGHPGMHREIPPIDLHRLGGMLGHTRGMPRGIPPVDLHRLEGIPPIMSQRPDHLGMPREIPPIDLHRLGGIPGHLTRGMPRGIPPIMSNRLGHLGIPRGIPLIMSIRPDHHRGLPRGIFTIILHCPIDLHRLRIRPISPVDLQEEIQRENNVAKEVIHH